MISDEENPAPNDEASPEEQNLIERSSAPTVLDLRAALKDLFKTADEEPDSTPPNDSLPQRQG